MTVSEVNAVFLVIEYMYATLPKKTWKCLKDSYLKVSKLCRDISASSFTLLTRK